MDLSYDIERRSAETDAATYIADYRRVEYFLQFCRQCGNYGNRHGCPPFDHDTLALIQPYSKVRIIGVKITPRDKHLPLAAANDLMAPIPLKLNEELIATEAELAGRAFGFVGTCPYCNSCSRTSGLSCRHPDKVRPSLEAIGFDISKTASDLLGIDIKWSRDGFLPEYLTLVCGVFSGTAC